MTMMLVQIVGIIFTVIGLSMMVNKKGVPALIIEAGNNPGLWWLYGCVALVIGSILLVINHSWSSGTKSVITFFGWLAVLKGIFILVFPKTAASFYKRVCRSGLVVSVGVIIFVLGLVFLYKGFM